MMGGKMKALSNVKEQLRKNIELNFHITKFSFFERKWKKQQLKPSWEENPLQLNLK